VQLPDPVPLEPPNHRVSRVVTKAVREMEAHTALKYAFVTQMERVEEMRAQEKLHPDLIITGDGHKSIDGFTPEQRFFLGWEQVWGTNQRAEAARLQTNTDSHPLAHFRGNGPISNMEAFAKAFGCKKGDPMVREQSCKIW
jgi:Peptidase family M13